MSESGAMDRRGFSQLTTAALLGMVAGAAAESEEAVAQPAPPPKAKVKAVDRRNLFLSEPNICRGLNVCKGKGRGDGQGGPNKCVGTSVCATVSDHTCAGNNDCRGQGACDVGDPAIYEVGYPGENTCKAKGACGVPIPIEKDHIWRQARRRFEAIIKDAGGNAGPAPRRAR